MNITILGIESSCDDTSAAIIRNGILLSNEIANQEVHIKYGGVVPELASRSHQQNIIPVVEAAIKNAGISKNNIDAVAFTRGPGLLGSLLVGTSFAKGFSLSQNIPLIDVNHLQGHILSLFIQEKGKENLLPKFPFLCLLVSGGHSQILIVKDHLNMEIIGQTIDDAAGEAFDKCAKVIGLPYPGGPVVDKYAQKGDPNAMEFNKPKIPGLNYSFSGMKTSFLYNIRDSIKLNQNFIDENMFDICASLQKTIVDILMAKLRRAVKETGIKEIGVAGGVSANSGLRNKLMEDAAKRHWKIHIPHIKFTTDNAAMIAISGYYKYRAGKFAALDVTPLPRWNM
ncbi:MAG: tRNA (adenosine(37)-N6)-threonylcarbamoyltransferase complex transferase subunit TsaD [Bacteroidota bacterium]|nr:tRNA (adenosine(37)-N6)-threonylcarbamoyltransferase complex transferase subunit TsaD [Bacteroidota bacterium]